MSDDMRPGTGGSAARVRIQRAENGIVALAIVTAVVLAGLPWWVLLAAFVLFDLSALGYLRDSHVGALCYNLVHSYCAPALLTVVYTVLRVRGHEAEWLVLLAASWGFHVAVDRALGYGLKLGSFQQAHLGRIGGAKSVRNPSR